MVLKKMRSLFVKAIFLLSILSCTNNKKVWRYNKQIILQMVDVQKTCEISIDSVFLSRYFQHKLRVELPSLL